MSGVLGKRLLNVPRIQLLEEEQAARSIVVSNISLQTTKESVVIHFQRQKNGGGEIDHIHIPKKGTAVITFEKSEVVETVLEHSHTLEGSTLKLHRLNSDYSSEVLQLVKARVNFGRFQLSSQEWVKALEVLKDKTEVQCRPVSNKECVLYGTFNQIFTAQTFLQDILHRRPLSLQQSKGANDAIHQVDTTQTQQNSSEMRDIDNFNTIDVNSFEVQPQFMKFLKQVYKNKLQDIEETHGVEIVWSENASQVQIHSSEILNNPHSYRKGCDAFIDLYQNLYPNMSREVVELKSAYDRTFIMEAITTVEIENPVVIEMIDNKLLVFAERNNIISSVQALKEKLGSSQGGSRKTRRSQRNTNRSAREHESSQEDRFSALMQLLGNGVKLSLYQSDITDERVNAIVNVANDALQHGGGVAAAIVRKGGRQIEEESRRIMSDRKWRPLNVGDAVYTRGGNLSCQFVIHTVGPRWNTRERSSCISLLRRACVESLRLAARLELCSIALPAISSGIFGMPKNICAQVMFEAIEEFSSSIDAEFSTLRDVRTVIIDDETISVFREEFVKRYTSQETSSTTLPHQEHRPRPSNEEQEASSALNVTVKHPSFSSSKDSSNERSKKSSEDSDNVESPNEGADPNVESNESSEQMPDSLKKVHPSNSKNIPNASKDNPPNGNEKTNVETDVHGSNKEKGLRGSPLVKRPNKNGKDSDSVESSNEGDAPNVESNDNREEMPVKIKEVLPSNNYNIPNASKDNPPNGSERTNVETEVRGSSMEKSLRSSPLLKRFNKSGKDSDNVESSNEEDGPNVKNNEHREEMPVSIKEGLPSNRNNFPNANKDSPPNGNEKSNAETEVHGSNKEKDLRGSPLVKRSNKSGEDRDNAASSNQRVASNVENNEHHEEMPVSIKEGLPSKNDNFPNASKDNPSNCHDKSNLETEFHGWNEEKDLRGSPLVKRSNKSGEDRENAESSNQGVASNVENNEHHEEMPVSMKEGLPSNRNNFPNASKDSPPNGNEKSNAETEVHGSNKEKDLRGSPLVKRFNKSGEDRDNAASSNQRVASNVENNEHREEMPVSIKEGLPSKNNNFPNTSKDNPSNCHDKSNVETEVHGSNMDKGLRGSLLVKRSNKSGKDSDNVESSNEEVGTNVESNDHREEMPVSIKEGLPSNKYDIPNASNDNPSNGNEKSNVETDAHGSNMEKGMKVSLLVKRSKLPNVATSGRPSSGRGRGILAATFYGKLQEEAGSESNGSTQLAKPRVKKSANVGRGGGITYATNKSPPGLTVTEEGKRLAQNLGNGVKGDQNADPAESMRGREDSERNESSNEAFKEENQESKGNDQNIDDDKLNDVPGRRLPLKDGITKPEETKKDTVENTTTDGGKKTPTDENTNNLAGPNQPEKKPETGIQVDHSISNTTNDGASYPKGPSPSYHPETSPATENLTLTALHESVNVRYVVEERRATHSDAGSKPLCETQTIHPTGELKCSMCMNLKKDPVCPVKCGHYFCKSCIECFIENTMICPVCKKENLFRGNQPPGYMTWRTESYNSLAGYEEFGTIVLTFNFDKKIQGSEHPNPGEPYCGLFCTSYLPNNPAGQQLLSLLRSAFDARLMFTIGKCPATGEENNIVCNGIELKTNRSGGPANCGYPDPSYLDRAKSQLAEKGITQPYDRPVYYV